MRAAVSPAKLPDTPQQYELQLIVYLACGLAILRDTQPDEEIYREAGEWAAKLVTGMVQKLDGRNSREQIAKHVLVKLGNQV